MSAQDIKAIRTNRNELGWLQEQGATASNIPDAWKEYLVGLGYSGSIQDMQKAWLDAYNLDGILDDKLAKYWAGALQLPFNAEVGSAATFTRASASTMVIGDTLFHYATNEARVHPQKGVLIEGAITNLVIYSEDMEDAEWIKTNCSVTNNSVSAPDGTLTAAELAGSASLGNIKDSGISVSTTTPYTFSCFLKGDVTDARLQINLNSTGGTTQAFNLLDGTIGTGSGNDSATIEDIGNGWYRCSMTTTTDGLDTSATNFIVTSVSSTATIYAWGAQFEPLAFPSSHIPTNGSTVSRAADILSYDLSSAGWFNDGGAGTLVMDCNIPSTTIGTRHLMDLTNDGSYTDRIYLVQNVGETLYNITSGSVTQAGPDCSPDLGEGLGKIAVYWDTNDFGVYINGTQAATDISGSVPAAGMDTLYVGSNYQPLAQLYGYIKNLKYFPYRMSNADLARVTT